MKKIILILVLSIFVSRWSYAFIPPVTALVRDAFEGRRGGAVQEGILRHRVVLSSSEVVEVEEHWVGDASKAAVSFKLIGTGNALSGVYERRAYRLGSKVIPSESAVLIKYLYGTAEDFLTTLVGERFIKREQLQQYKQDFNPQGDPSTWELKDHYLIHEGIALGRVKGMPAVRIWNKTEEGANQIATKAVYFEKTGSGLRRLEWRNGDRVDGWTFSDFSRFQSPGLFPKRLLLDIAGKEVVSSELVIMKTGRATDSKALSKSSSSSQSLEEAVSLLLKFR